MTQQILNTFQRVELFFEYDSKNRPLFFWMWLKNWIFWLKKIVKKLNSFQRIMTQRIELFLKKNDAKSFFSKKNFWFEEWNLLENMTHRIEFFKQKSDSKNWTLLILTQRTDFFRLKELNFSSNMAPRIELFLFSMTQRIKFFENYSKNWFFHVSKN